MRYTKKEARQKLATIAASTERRPMPRPAVFADKTKYSRARAKRQLRQNW